MFRRRRASGPIAAPSSQERPGIGTALVVDQEKVLEDPERFERPTF